MIVRVIEWAGFILPWISFLFLDYTTKRRYLPVALFVTIINTIFSQVAITYKWWEIYQTLFSWAPIADISLTYSSFLVATIWIFRFTFGRPWLYALVNLILDGVFAFGITIFIENIGILRFVNISKLNLFLLMIGMSIVIYLFQLWWESDSQVFDKVRRNRY